MVSLKLLQTVGASILAFTSKGKVLVERDSASGLASHVQNSPVNRPGASLKELETVESPLEPGMAAVLYLFELR